MVTFHESRCQAVPVATVDLVWEHALREAAMTFVARLRAATDNRITRDELQQFRFRGENVKLLDTGRGIRNPRQLAATLTIMTSPRSKYDDTPGPEGLLRYAIREGELGSGDNRKLRAAFELRLPLIWFNAVAPGVFNAHLPVFLVEEEADRKRYVVALGEDQLLMAPQLLAARSSEDSMEELLAQRRYVQAMSKQRLHQPRFRAGVMIAYETRCAVCRLGHAALLDAAHIIEDGQPGGDPVTANGLALCKIHHAAYDRDILGISPDRVVHINHQVLQERDGPMLKHGLQDLHGAPLAVIPKRKSQQPDADRLATRFERFAQAG